MTRAPVRPPTEELADFLAIVSSYDEPAAALRAAVEQAAIALEAEVGAVVQDGVAVASVGFAEGHVPHGDLAAVTTGELRILDVPGPGPSCAISAPIGETGADAYLVVTRPRSESFTVEEVHLVRSMAGVLQLVLQALNTVKAEARLRQRIQRQEAENARLQQSLEEGRRLLEELTRRQRSQRATTPIQELLGAVDASTRLTIFTRPGDFGPPTLNSRSFLPTGDV